jgi:ABC-type Mn2+/Zn2+ transport system ATPase subunit
MAQLARRRSSQLWTHDLQAAFDGTSSTAQVAALHDMDLVRANFPETLLLARGEVAWGPTAEVLTAENLLEARRMCEAFDDSAATCAVDDVPSKAA